MNRCIFFIFYFIITQTILSQQINWIVFSNQEIGISRSSIMTIAEDKDGIIWAGTNEEGILKYDGQSWTKYDLSNSSFDINFIWTIAVDSFNNKWFGTYGSTNGLLRYDNQNWSIFNISDYGLSGSSIFSIAFDTSNNLWMGTYWDGLANFDGDTTWKIFNSSNSGILQPQEEINCVAIDKDGFLWYGSDGYGGGIFNRDSNWVHLLPSQGFDEVLLSVGFDESGNTWFGGQRFVTRYDVASQITNYKYKEGGVRYFNLIEDTDNVVWFTTLLEGFLKLDYSEGEKWTKLFPESFGLDSIGCQGLTRDHYGNFWIGYTNGYVAVYNPHGIVGLTDISDNINKPFNFSLSQNYPNPFNPTTKIKFVIPQSAFVNLKVFDVLGREVATLVNEEKPAGSYEVEFSAQGGSASGENGSNLSSGIYFYKLNAGKYSSVKKMILLK